MSNDPLSKYTFKESSGSGLFLSIKKGDSIKLRVLTNDPIVHIDKYGNTRFAFVVWNWDEERAQVLDKGASIARPIQQLHTDEDYGADIQKIDVKLVATSTGPEDKDVEYSVQALPKANELTDEIIAEAKEIELESVIKGGFRMSEADKQETPVSDGDEPPVEALSKPSADDKPVDLSDIPF